MKYKHTNEYRVCKSEINKQRKRGWIESGLGLLGIVLGATLFEKGSILKGYVTGCEKMIDECIAEQEVGDNQYANDEPIDTTGEEL